MINHDIYEDFTLLIDENDRLIKDATAFIETGFYDKEQWSRVSSEYSFFLKFKKVIMMTGTNS